MDEQSLIQKVQEGQTEAFGALMDLHADRLRSVLALAAPSPHLIDELAHETFVFAYTHLHEFRRGTSLSAWLVSIARNLLRREVLRFSRERANLRRYSETHVRGTVARERRAENPEFPPRLLRSFAPAVRELLELRYELSLSTSEIARRIGRSDAWVRTTLFRVRQQLRDLMRGSIPGKLAEPPSV